MLKKSLALFIFVAIASISFAEDSYFVRWKDFVNSPQKKQITNWVEQVAYAELHKKKYPLIPKIKVPPFFGKLGLFVTIKKKNKVRGCFGSFYPNTNYFFSAIEKYLMGALYLDPRYKPLDDFNFENSEIIITIATMPQNVSDLSFLDLSENGVVINCNGNYRIFVPEEIVSIDYLKRFLNRSICTVQSFRAVTIKK